MTTIHPLAIQLVRCLPAALPAPEISADDDGDVSLDWIDSVRRSVSVSLGASGRLAYAWINGGASGHSVADFDGCNFPPVLSDLIRNHIADLGNMVGAPQPHCNQCGKEVARWNEGYCEDCCAENQRALNEHNQEYDLWNAMTEKQRDAAIKRSTR